MTNVDNVANESKAPHAVCSKCPFANKAFAKSTGPSDAKIAVVSRSPGYYEALNGRAFAGPSGQVLEHLLKMQGVTKDDVRLTNVVLCESEGPEEKGWGMAVACCAPRLEAEIANCDTVIAAGGEAIHSLGIAVGGVYGNRGYVHQRTTQNGKKQRLVVTNNPAVVVRDDGSFPDMVRDFRLAINPLPKAVLPNVNWTDDLGQAKEWALEVLEEFKKFEQGTLIAADIEARGTISGKKSGLSHTAQVVCAGFSARRDRSVVFGERPCLDDEFRNDYLRPLYELENLRYLWHNGKYDCKVLRTNGINARVDEDSMLLSWALDERPGDPESGAGGHSLEWLLKDELGWPKYEPSSVQHFKKTGEFTGDGVTSRKELYVYNGMDCAGTLSLFYTLEERARRDNVWDRPYKFMLIRLSEAFTKIELEGNLFDSDAAMDILEREVYPKLRDWRHAMRTISHKPQLNPNSPKQLSELMYDEWGLKHTLQRPKIERKGKRSTDAKVREEILLGDFTCTVSRDTFAQFAKFYDDWKSLDKQRGTYLEGLVLRRLADGRIYTDFKIHGTESGRPSSANPNMQNVTRPKEGLPNIRRAFVADPGCQYVSVDLSQAELRAIAVLSGDTELQAIYLDTDRSLHKETAKEFYGSNYTYEQYVRSKNINFGVVYWQSAFTFAQLYHMPREEAQRYIDWWFGRFPEVFRWTKNIEQQVITVGELQSPFGHKRRFYVIPSDQSARLHAIKSGINFLPQNIASQVTLWAMCDLCENLDWDIAQVRINVHDNLVLNVRNEYVEQIAAQVKDAMERAVKDSIGWDFPFKADVSVGPNWGSLKELAL